MRYFPGYGRQPEYRLQLSGYCEISDALSAYFTIITNFVFYMDILRPNRIASFSSTGIG
jgi:hypothetical protein